MAPFHPADGCPRFNFDEAVVQNARNRGLGGGLCGRPAGNVACHWTCHWRPDCRTCRLGGEFALRPAKRRARPSAAGRRRPWLPWRLPRLLRRRIRSARFGARARLPFGAAAADRGGASRQPSRATPLRPRAPLACPAAWLKHKQTSFSNHTSSHLPIGQVSGTEQSHALTSIRGQSRAAPPRCFALSLRASSRRPRCRPPTIRSARSRSPSLGRARRRRAPISGAAYHDGDQYAAPPPQRLSCVSSDAAAQCQIHEMTHGRRRDEDAAGRGRP